MTNTAELEQIPLYAGEEIAHIVRESVDEVTVHRGVVDPDHRGELPEKVDSYVITEDSTSLGAVEVFVEKTDESTEMLVTPDQRIATLEKSPHLFAVALEQIILKEKIDPSKLHIIAPKIGEQTLDVVKEDILSLAA